MLAQSYASGLFTALWLSFYFAKSVDKVSLAIKTLQLVPPHASIPRSLFVANEKSLEKIESLPAMKTLALFPDIPGSISERFANYNE